MLATEELRQTTTLQTNPHLPRTKDLFNLHSLCFIFFLGLRNSVGWWLNAQTLKFEDSVWDLHNLSVSFVNTDENLTLELSGRFNDLMLVKGLYGSLAHRKHIGGSVVLISFLRRLGRNLMQSLAFSQVISLVYSCPGVTDILCNWLEGWSVKRLLLALFNAWSSDSFHKNSLSTKMRIKEAQPLSLGLANSELWFWCFHAHAYSLSHVQLFATL